MAKNLNLEKGNTDPSFIRTGNNTCNAVYPYSTSVLSGFQSPNDVQPQTGPLTQAGLEYGGPGVCSIFNMEISPHTSFDWV